jgi:nitronate monooxygenase
MGARLIETSITRMFGLRYPIIGAPMFLISDVAMLKAMGEAGMMGVMPALNCRSTEALRVAIRTLREAAVPFGINLILLENPRLEADLTVCLEERVPLIVTSLGNPSELIVRARAAGVRVFCDVVSLRHAQKAAEAGADALVAVGAGAGGHAGVISPFVLVPYLRRKLSIPIVAAGGIADGQTLAAALALGADAAYMGTRFIASTEAPVGDDYKRALIESGPENIVYTAEVTGHPANFLELSVERYRLLREAGESAGKRWRDVWSAGQTVGLIEAVQPTATIVAEIVEEYERVRRSLPPLQPDA